MADKIRYCVTVKLEWAAPPDDIDSTSRGRIITLGVYDDVKDAEHEANAFLEMLENQFPLNPHQNYKKRFPCLGMLISDLGYIETPFYFCVKIKKLVTMEDLESVIDGILEDRKAFFEWKEKEEDEE